jgi:hypothetical protein
MSFQKAIGAARIGWIGLVIATLIGGCATDKRAQNPDSAKPLADFNGLFSGETISGDNHRVEVSFNVERQGDRISGTYRCAPGNATCRNQMLKGSVSGAVDARGIQVSLQDGSWCLYNLDKFYRGESEGDYSCYLGGMLVEHGVFNLKRVGSD